MGKDDLLNDDFLRDLVQRGSSDTPSPDFVVHVMNKIQTLPERISLKSRFFLCLKTIFPYVLLVIFVLFFFFSSDLPFSKYLPGKEYYSHVLLPYFNFFRDAFKMFFSSKYLSLGVIVLFAVGLLILIEYLFSRKTRDFFLSKGL